jgi:hypothetical protein
VAHGKAGIDASSIQASSNVNEEVDMGASAIKGAIFEYLVRRVFKRCGFSNVTPDNIYSYKSGNLLMVHGKGAAHDADVFVEPPFQIPFTYPSRLIFECKAYKTKLKLPIIRNALGLRNDLNDFEIVTHKTLQSRKNNKRAQLAIEQRQRYWLQVGVAGINGFTKPAIEFAINNKIPLFSLSWILPSSTITAMNELTDEDLLSSTEEEISVLKEALNNRDVDLEDTDLFEPNEVISRSERLVEIFSWSQHITNFFSIGVLETGALIYLIPESDPVMIDSFFTHGSNNLYAKFSYINDRPESWTMQIHPANQEGNYIQFRFKIPNAFLNEWADQGYNKQKALDLKGQYFSRIMLFHAQPLNDNPFSIVRINEEWLRSFRDQV